MTNLEPADLELIIVRIKEISGIDFSGYARASLLRRASKYALKHNLDGAQLWLRIEEGGQFLYDFIQDLTVNYSEMFRDPEVFVKLRSDVLGYLESFPSIRLWVAGCAAGEEAFSLSILLKEAGLLDKSLIYATDLSQRILAKAREGVFSLGSMRNFSENYMLSNGTHSLSDYYHVAYGKAIIKSELRKNIVFSLHNLTGDGVFNEFQLISCRNVMIYFNAEQRLKVFILLYESLSMFGFLCLGKRETLGHSGLEKCFRTIDAKLNIYQKIQ